MVEKALIYIIEQRQKSVSGLNKTNIILEVKI